MFIKCCLPDTSRGSIFDNGNAKEFMDVIGQTFKESESEYATLMSSLWIKYDNVVGVKGFSSQYVQVPERLKELKVPDADEFLVHHVLS